MKQDKWLNGYARRMMPLAAIGSLSLMVSSVLAAPTIEKSVKLDPGLYELVVSPSTHTVFVASTGTRGSNTASVITLDGATLERKAAIDVSASPVYGLAFNDKTQTLYGTDTRNGAVIAIDAKTGKVAAIIKGTEEAHLREAVVDESANVIYASAVGGEPGSERAALNAVWVIDGKTNTISHVISVETGTLTGITFDAKSNRLYGTGMSANEVVAIDLAQRKVVQRWPSGGVRPTNAAFDAESGRIFVANQESGTLTVLDSKDGKLLKSVATGAGALSVAFNPKANQIYVANRMAGTVTVVDAKSYEVTAQLATGTLPQTVAVDREANRVYVTNKARGLPRNAPADAKPVEDPNGDTVVLIKP